MQVKIYVFKFLNVVVGQDVGLLEVHIWIQRFSYKGLPERGQEVQGQGNISPDGNAQQLPKKVQQLLLAVADGAGCQNVLALERGGERASAWSGVE